MDTPRPHSNEWYDALAMVQDGYYYPWQSTVGAGDGETAYLELVRQHLAPDSRVLDVGCGHGEVALSLAPLCAEVVAYDRVSGYIEIGRANAKEQGVENVSFLCYDARDPAHDQLRLPVDDKSVDLIISRRGPLHWIEDARRAAKDGATLIALCPMEEPIPAWSSKLPHVLYYENCGRFTGAGSIHQSVENRLHQAGLIMHSGWGFDVPEAFSDPRELYTVLTWGVPAEKIPSYDDVAYKFDTIYATYAEADGIVLRHCRFLWKAIVD